MAEAGAEELRKKSNLFRHAPMDLLEFGSVNETRVSKSLPALASEVISNF